MSAQTPLQDGVDKENVGPGGKPLRVQQGIGLGSVGRKVLGRRDNTLPIESFSTQKLASLKPRNLGTPGYSGKAAATPTSVQAARTSGSQSWEEDVKSYVQCQDAAGEPFHSQRRTLSSALLSTSPSDSKAAECWWTFLANEEAALAGAGANVTVELSMGAKMGRQAISLFQLYKWATRVLPKRNSEAYLQLWLGYARHQGYRNQHEARETYKTLKDQNVGNASVSASLYVEWAALEVSAGETDRALSIVRKGIKADAQPISELHALEARLSAGHKGAGETMTTKRVGAPNAHTSAATTFLLPTPAPRAVRRMRDFTQTNSLDMAFSHNAASTLERDAAGEAVTADVSSRAPAAAAPADHLTPICETQQPSPSKASQNGSGSQEKQPPQQQDAAASAHTEAARMDATVVVRRGAGGQHTSHSSLSGGSGASDEATVTINNNPRLATPALTGRTDVSSSSSGSGEAVTLDLKLRATAEMAAAPSGQRPPQPPAHAEEPTVMVNRAPRPGILARPALGGLRAGPRRTGLGGGAARVVLQSTAGAPAGDCAPAALTDSGKKRKAESDARSAALPQGTGGPKRRASPDVDMRARQECSPRRAYTVMTTPNGSLHHQHGKPDLVSQAQSGGAAARPSCSEAAAGAAAEQGRGPLEGPSSSSASPDETLQVVHRARPPTVPEQARLPAMSMGAPPPAPRGGRRAPVLVPPRPSSNDADETVPLINGGLAAKALRGRQSIAPQRAQSHMEDVHMTRPGTGAMALTEQPTALLSHPSSSAAAHSGNGAQSRTPAHNTAGQPEAAAAQDPDQTVPLSRSGAAPEAEQSERPRLVPPPPPPLFAARPSAPAAAPDAGPAVAERAAAAGRPVMGPPPSRPRQPLSSITVPNQQQQQEQRPQHQAEQQSAAPEPSHKAQAQGQAPRMRRVREDENSVVVRGTRYTKLECVGRGGSSKVYKVMAPSRKIYALKRIRLTGRDHEAAAGFIDEITLLQRLRGHSNIIQLIDAEVIRGEGLIYMVLEYGDIDLARLLARHEAAQREGGATELDENFIRLYWQQMLQAVHTIHEARIVHSDLKPANFLVVEGQLKLIDFGIAKAISSDTTSIAREAQVGTLNYMSPEAILGGATNIRGGPPMKVGRPSDVWSLGCILYQMVYGHTPFSSLAFIQKMHAITDPAHRVAMPPLKNGALSDVIRRCLDRNARTRITMQELLAHPFLRPTAAAVPATPESLVGLTREQLKKLLAQVSAASASGCPADLDTVSEELFRQLSSGQTVNLASILGRARDRSPAEDTPAAAKPCIEAPRGGDAAVPAAPSDAAAGRQHVAAPAQGAAKAPLQQRAAPVALRAQDIMAGRAALKRVDPAAHRPAAPRGAAAEDSLEARLREGLAKFRFDDTAGSSAAAAGNGSDDNTDFSS